MSDSTVTMQDLIERNHARHQRDHAEETVKISQLWEAVDGLIREGFPVEHTTWNASHLTIDVSVADLPRVYRAVGRIKVWYKDVAYSGGEVLTDHIQVMLRAERCPGLHIRYVKPLADGSSAPKKCRIVTTSRVETSTQLVCDVA